MKTKKQLYESPQCVEFSVNIAHSSICTESFKSTLEDWKEEEVDF